MKKIHFLSLIVILLCISLTGCKSSDYKEAVSLEEAGEYSAALAIFEELSDYKDSANRIISCKAMIAAIDEYEAAKSNVEQKNASLDAEISEAENTISEGKTPLDNALIPALETVISETKAVKATIPEMPSTVDEINEVVSKLNSVNYDVAIERLRSQKETLETSIKQYSLVNAPSEAYVIQCLSKVPNDPNGNLNKAGGYTAQVYFSSDLVNQASVYGNSIIEKGTDCGGSIEVYPNASDAEKRNDYLASFDGSIFASGSHTVVGTVLVRTSDELTASQQKALEANIIAELTNIENY